jgi:methionine synthase II (cobalamin-independent)
MKTILSIALLAGFALASEPIKTTDAEQVKLLRLQTALANAQREMSAAEAQYMKADAAAKQISEALQKEVEALKAAKKCPDCQIDPKDFSLIPPELKK